jgi:hypothetical protein
MKFDVNGITPDNAILVLKTLAKEDKKIEKRIQQVLTQLISIVDLEEVASDVSSALDSLEAEDLWDQSGPTRYGYVEPCDIAPEMMEGALKPFLMQLKEYRSLARIKEAKIYCMGILKGLYLFDQESNTQFREWAEDVAQNIFDGLLDKWKKEYKDRSFLNDIKKFTKNNCPEWF